jgi:hypothetical protein
MEPVAAYPLALVLAAPTIGPCIVQLSPVPSNIYDVDCFYYDPVANVSCGSFGAILAFASAHGHPVVMHECPDIHQFQLTYPSAIIHPINKVPPAIITRGLALLALGDTLAPRAIAPPPLAVVVPPLAGDQQFVIQTALSTSVDEETPSVRSCPLLSYKSLSHGGDPPPAGVIPSPSASIRALIGSQIPSVVVKPPPPIVAHGVPQVRVPRVPPAYGPPCPGPEGLAQPPSAVGGRRFLGYFGSSPIYRGSPHFHGGVNSHQRHVFSFPSSGLMTEHWHTYNFPGGIPPAVPSFIHGPRRSLPSHGGSPHVSASLASTLALAAPPLRPLRHEDLSGSSASELTMSFWPSLPAVAAPAVVSPAVAPSTVQALPPVAVSTPQVVEVDSLESVVPLAPAPLLMICPAEPFKLPLIADAKAYLNLLSILQYYLCRPEFSTQRPDNALITDSRAGMLKPVLIGRDRLEWQFKMGPCVCCSKTRGRCTMGKASKCLLC